MCLHQGRDYLSSRRPKRAFSCFERALRECPPEDSKGLSLVLFYCGLSLEELGVEERALECWRSSLDYDGESPSKRMLERYEKSDMGKEERSYHGFVAIQTAKYFQLEDKRRFDTQDEYDTVLGIIDAYWEELKDSGILGMYPPEDIFYLFYEVHIRFRDHMRKDFTRGPKEEGGGSKILRFRTDS